MKKYIAFIMTLVICMSLCACGRNDDSNSKTNTTESETEQKSYTEQDVLKGMSEQDIVRCSEYLGGHCVPYYGITEFIDAIQKVNPENAFSQELLSRYEALELDSRTDFEKDFFEIIPNVMCTGWGNHTTNPDEIGFDIEPEFFGNAWIVGYTNEKANSERAIIVETTGFKWLKYPYAYLLAYDGEFSIDGITAETLDSTYGIDATAEKGKVINQSGSMGTRTDYTKHIAEVEASFTDSEYVMIPSERIDALIEEYMNFYSLLKLFVDNEYFDYDPYNDTFDLQEEREEEMKLKNSEPEIGMTADEVLMGLWGEPDKKNIDEYEWGTEEQWVYEGRGYVYFEDGIVTSIQHRE